MQASAEEEGIEPNGVQDKASGNADFVGTALEHLNFDQDTAYIYIYMHTHTHTTHTHTHTHTRTHARTHTHTSTNTKIRQKFPQLQ